jgi:hypothetical protein
VLSPKRYSDAASKVNLEARSWNSTALVSLDPEALGDESLLIAATSACECLAYTEKSSKFSRRKNGRAALRCIFHKSPSELKMPVPEVAVSKVTRRLRCHAHQAYSKERLAAPEGAILNNM